MVHKECKVHIPACLSVTVSAHMFSFRDAGKMEVQTILSFNKDNTRESNLKLMGSPTRETTFSTYFTFEILCFTGLFWTVAVRVKGRA